MGINLKTITNFLTFTVCILLIVFLQQKQTNSINVSSSVLQTEEQKKEKLFLTLQKKMPSLGFSNLKADWIYLKFVQYYGDTYIRQQIGYSLTPDFFQSIIDNDPRFIKAILMLSTANSVYAKQPKATVELLEQVLSKISPQVDPLTPFVWSYKGVDEMLYLGDVARAKNSFEMGSQWALQTNHPAKEAIARRNQETANFLATNPDTEKIKISSWMYLLQTSESVVTQKLAIEQIIALGGKVTYTPEGFLQVYFPKKD
jgi:hypothetical protein